MLLLITLLIVAIASPSTQIVQDALENQILGPGFTVANEYCGLLIKVYILIRTAYIRDFTCTQKPEVLIMALVSYPIDRFQFTTRWSRIGYQGNYDHHHSGKTTHRQKHYNIRVQQHPG